MATSLSIDNVTARILWTFTQTQNWGADTTQSSSFTYLSGFSNGVAANQADRLYAAKGTINPSTTLTLDLAAGLTDVFGASITFARVKLFYFELTTDTAGSSVTLGASGTFPAKLWFGDAATDTLTVQNGGLFLIEAPTAAGYPVTAGTADLLAIVNNDSVNVATYRIAIIGGAT